MPKKGTKKQNPDKEKVGCMVPFCTAEFCDAKRKSFCALRKYFLEHQKAVRKAVSGMEELNHYIYYWRDNASGKEPEDKSRDKEAS